MFVHATALVVREHGILIRGRSGSGKTTLAALLIGEAERAGQFARLVGDDRVSLSNHEGRVVVRSHPAIAGLIERRTHGIVPVPFATVCVLRLVVDLQAPDEPLVRLPDQSTRMVEIAGATLTCVQVTGLIRMLDCRWILDTLATL